LKLANQRIKIRKNALHNGIIRRNFGNNPGLSRGVQDWKGSKKFSKTSINYWNFEKNFGDF